MRDREPAHLLDRDTLGQRRPAGHMAFAAQHVRHAGIKCGLDADDIDCRIDRLGRDGAAGNQPAAADRDHQHIETGHLFEDFQRDRALPGDDARVVIGVDLDEAVIRNEFFDTRLGFADRFPVQDDGGAVRARRRHLHEGRRHRHDDGRRDFQPRGVIGDRLGVVAGRHGDDAALAFGLAQRSKFVERAAVLERISDLQVFVFDVDLGAGKGGKLGRRQHGRAQHHALDHAAGRFDIGNGDGQRLLPRGPTENHAARPAGIPAGGGPLARARFLRHFGYNDANGARTQGPSYVN